MKGMKVLSGILFISFFLCFQAEGAKSFTDNGNGTVTDNDTSLIWQQGEGGSMIWEAALAYCETLSLGGGNDWRLPNKNELTSLVDYSRDNPSVNPIFTGANSSSYWSSTTYANRSAHVWYVAFYGGSVNYTRKTNNGWVRVRCVRGGQ